MILTSLERAFLQRLSTGPWTSPPLFDHSLIARLIEAGFVETQTFPSGSIRYEITDTGLAAIADERTAAASAASPEGLLSRI